ncbi:invasion associated locus B family protein [Methylorubrum thiocyanatum]
MATSTIAAMLLISQPAKSQLRGSFDGEEAETSAPLSVPNFRIKPMEGAPVAAGVRRVIQTFGGWTLICDEFKRGRVCNASQSIVAADGAFAFSWSMAATKGGEPVFVLRAPVAEFSAHTVTLKFGAVETVIRLETCDTRLCIGFLPVDVGIIQRIKAQGVVAVRYRKTEGGAPVEFAASFDGLRAALGSIR